MDIVFVERDYDSYFGDVMKEVYIDYEPKVLVPRSNLRPDAEELLKKKLEKGGSLTKKEILNCITW